ncbi:hypothetical protein B0H66DRAFT_551849 [Apodospora peruviana]|uniref:N-acetyltransferase domain-containing protein n=1 Tax=Apodospora peruviana TaxID=516989 RepID=A0AAE0IKS4_9PEZI|nr:hypothetical protein B0H66DRAFT_551849 [Apodospora peruviana]
MSSGPLPSVRRNLCNFPTHTAYLANILSTLRLNFADRIQEDMHYYKVTDTSIDAETDPYRGIICFCVWKIHDIANPSTSKGGTRNQPLRPSNFPSTRLAKYVAQVADEFREKHFPDESYLFFELLMTVPAHQRRGAGKILIKYALEMADRRGILVSAGQGSEDGLGLYIKCGYHPATEFRMDMRPYGVDAEPVRQWMLIRRLNNAAGVIGSKL